MELRSYYKLVEDFYTQDEFHAPDQQGLHGCIGLQSEVGELADIYKKAIFHARGINRDDIIDEAGDILYYLQMELASVGSNIEECARRNAVKLIFRKENGKNKAAEREEQLKVANG